MNRAATWGMIAAVCAGSVAIVAIAPGVPSADGVFIAAVWVVAAAAIAEAAALRFRFRRERACLTLSGAAVVIAALYSGPLAAAMAAATAGLVSAVAERKLRPEMVALGVAERLARAAAAVAVASWLIDVGSVSNPASWAAIALVASAAELTAEVVGSVGRWSAGTRRSANLLAGRAGLGLFAAALVSSASVAASVIASVDPWAALVLLVPVIGTALARWLATREAANDDKIKFLNEVPGQSPVAVRQDPLLSLMTRAEQELGAVSVELVLFDHSSSGSRVIRCIGGGVVEEVLDGATTVVLRRLSTGLGDVDRLGASQTGTLVNLHGANAVSALAGSITKAGEPIALMVAAGSISSFGAFGNDTAATFDRFRHRIQTALVKQQIETQAACDPLTGLPTQDVFDDRTRSAMSGDGSVAALRIDLDDFAVVNDALGHAAGDAILSVISVRIRRCLGPDDIAARFEGDEFGVLLVGPNDPVAVATRIVEEVHQPITIAGQNVSVAVSVGISSSDSDTDAGDLLTHADSAMRQAKERGKGVVAVFGSDLVEMGGGPVRTSLARALDADDNALSVVYQPIFALGTSDDQATSVGPVAGFEALARWRSEASRSPEHTFIEQAEAEGVIGVVDGKVFDQVLNDQLRLLGGASDGARFVAVNLSPLTLADESLPERLAHAADAAGVDRSSVMIEISERTLVEQPGMVVGRLRALTRMGFQASIDGFGTGGTSFSVLKQ
ncbi:MAG: diguanylate cyclase, partial [Acidimicrobiales bacterium]|nr:diguanylate cyclase [Acidimicrobiales bacterium]